MLSRDQNLYADGVLIQSESDDWIWYQGRASALISCGLVQESWLPGSPGCGKSSQVVALTADGEGHRLPPHSQAKRNVGLYGSVMILKSGGLFRVCKFFTPAERERRAAESQKQEQQQTWAAAKDAKRQEETHLEAWRHGVTRRIEELARLLEGKLVFEGMPEISLSENGAADAAKAINDLRGVLQRSAPRVKGTESYGNVIALRGAAYSSMQR